VNWFGRWLRRNRLESQLDAELRDHIERQVADYIREGASEADARRRVRLEFGGLDQVKELCRDARGTRLVEELAQDFRYAYRIFLKSPGFAIVGVITLALGIGANMAVFTLVDAVLLRQLPVRDPEQLVLLRRIQSQQSSQHFSYPQIERFAQQRQLFSSLSAIGTDRVAVGPLDAPEATAAVWVTGEYYQTLGVTPAAGRLLTPQDDEPGATPVAVISDNLWMRRFGRAADALGRSLLIEGTPVEIVGVTPPRFNGVMVGEGADITLPIHARPRLQPERADFLGPPAFWLIALGRPQPGLSHDQLKAQLATVWQQVLNETTSTLISGARTRLLASTLEVDSGATGWGRLRDRFRERLLASMALVTVVLLIACVNVANLLLARATSRQRELALRLAMGASRGRVVRQLVTESGLLSVAGAALGSVLAFAGSRALVALVQSAPAGPDSAGIVLDLTPDWRMFAFTTLLATATTALFGIVTALRAGRVEPVLAMTIGSARNAERSGRLGTALVSIQVALSLLMLITAGLFGQTLRNLQTLDRGFRHDEVLLVGIDHSRTGLSGPALKAFFDEQVASVERITGVRAASLAAITPLQGGGISQSVALNGQPIADEVYYNNVGPRYFDALRTPLILGRDFTPEDATSRGGVAIVNESFVRQYLPDGSPLAARLQVGGFRVGGKRDLQIVGVVKDAVYETLRVAPPPTVYGPFVQRSAGNVTLVVYAPGAVAPVAAAIRAQLQPTLAGRVLRIRTLTAQLDSSLAQERLMASVATVFGALALALAAIGLYGLLAYWVSRRTHELGIRMALGAARSAVLHLVLRDAARMLLLGTALGLAVAAGVTRYLSSMLFGLTRNDPVTIGGSIAILALVGIAAAALPARRATRVDPLVALRAE
jgi:putative ABC transport system permease protein